MARARATPTSRLSVDDWIQAGYALLAEQGIKALKIDRLCGRLGVTKGSFYWHFTDMASYRAALAHAWGELRDEDRRQFDEMGQIAPRERLSRMMTALVGPRQWTLERAMRGQARVRLRARRGLLADIVGEIETILAAGDPVPRMVRSEARLAAAHIVHDSRAVIGALLEASGASAHFLDNPLQRIKRDVDVLSGHVIFDYDTSRELAGALALGMKISPIAMV